MLGRFLEHSRILSFQTGDKVVGVDRQRRPDAAQPRPPRSRCSTPIEDSRLRVEIGVVLDALLADTRFSWELDADGAWSRTSPGPGERRVSAQEALMKRATKRAKKA